MSSIFEVSAQLVLLLSVALNAGDPAGTRPAGSAVYVIPEVSSSPAPIPFSEQVWLEAVMNGTSDDDVRSYASRVFKTSGGKFYVPSEREYAEIVNLRRDRARAAEVAVGFAARNAPRLREELARTVTVGDLYVAHLLGCDTAVALLKAAAERPDELLREHFSHLIARYPELGGRQRSARLGVVVSRLKNAAERRPEGADVAVWFANGVSNSAMSALKGAVKDETYASTSIRDLVPAGWAAVVTTPR